MAFTMTLIPTWLSLLKSIEEIEVEMKKIIKENQRFERLEVSRDEAKKIISEMGQDTLQAGSIGRHP